MAESVKVVVRCRPSNQRETSMGCKIIISMDPSRGQCSIVNPGDAKAPPKSFTFDGAYGIDSTTEQIYADIVFPLVENVLEGYNGTVFAYGQTGSGKSFSMQGPDGIPVQKGIIPRTFEHIFEATSTTENVKFLVCASYLEIYNEDVRDLLGPDIKAKLEIKEHPEKGIYVAGLSMHAVNNVKEIDHLMQKGLKSRATGATQMNADSSRSHSIFTVHLEMMESREDGEHIKTTKLHLVDLAGSERQAKTGATGERLKEATKINLSLSALGNVISALVDGKSTHIPYRDSKLTRILQDSLGGNTKTIMVACMSPADNNYDETLSTLRYANRAKNIKNKPKINEDPKDALLREYQDEIQRLKAILAGGGGAAAVPGGATVMDAEGIEKEKQKIRQEYAEEMEALKKKYKEEQTSKSKLQEDMAKLKQHLDEQLTSVGQKSSQKGSVAPNSSPTAGMAPEKQAEEALKKLEMLQQRMVGGEQANNEALKQQRKKKKTDAEKKRLKLAEVLAKVDADDPMMHVYNSVQEKLEAVSKEMDKEKKKTKLLENEIHDLQSEFELDRIDYLDTIRRQDQQLKLLQQILDKVQPCLRRDSNYFNLEKIKKDATWDEDLQKWHLPEMGLSKTQFPTGGMGGGVMPGGRAAQTNGTSMNGFGSSALVDDNDDERLLRSKLEASSAENIAANYFKPLRSSNIINKTEQDKRRNVDNRTSYFPENQHTWDNLMNGVIYTNDIYERQQTNNINGTSKKPQRLESLPGAAVPSAKKSRRKQEIDVVFAR